MEQVSQKMLRAHQSDRKTMNSSTCQKTIITTQLQKEQIKLKKLVVVSAPGSGDPEHQRIVKRGKRVWKSEEAHGLSNRRTAPWLMWSKGLLHAGELKWERRTRRCTARVVAQSEECVDQPCPRYYCCNQSSATPNWSVSLSPLIKDTFARVVYLQFTCAKTTKIPNKCSSMIL